MGFFYCFRRKQFDQAEATDAGERTELALTTFCCCRTVTGVIVTADVEFRLFSVSSRRAYRAEAEELPLPALGPLADSHFYLSAELDGCVV